jgi:hypothetical protein
VSAHTWCKRTARPGEYLVMDRRTMRSVGLVVKQPRKGWSPILPTGDVLPTVATRDAAEALLSAYTPDGKPTR